MNNSAVIKTLSVDKSASLISLQPGNTHRPATNMHRKRSINHFNQSFGRVPVRSRSTNEFSFADAYFNASTIRLSIRGSEDLANFPFFHAFNVVLPCLFTERIVRSAIT